MAGTWKKDPTSRRTTPRPIGWKTLRAEVIRRDGGRCTWVLGTEGGGSWRDRAHLNRCPSPGTDVDHIGDPTDHRTDNLRLLCSTHHDKRTARQANEAKKMKAAQRRRPQQRHPGLL